MGTILHERCGCDFCNEVAAFYDERRKAVEQAREQFDALVARPADPPQYYGMLTQLRVGKKWPGILIDQPRSDYWIRDEGGG